VHPCQQAVRSTQARSLRFFHEATNSFHLDSYMRQRVGIRVSWIRHRLNLPRSIKLPISNCHYIKLPISNCLWTPPGTSGRIYFGLPWYYQFESSCYDPEKNHSRPFESQREERKWFPPLGSGKRGIIQTIGGRNVWRSTKKRASGAPFASITAR